MSNNSESTENTEQYIDNRSDLYYNDDNIF